MFNSSLNEKVFFVTFVLFFLMISLSSGKTQPPCFPIDNTEQYKILVDNWYSSAKIEDFSVSGFNFCKPDRNKNYVSGIIILSSENLSELGLRYVVTQSAYVDESNAFKINSKIDTQEIKRLINQFESKREVRDFVSVFNSTIEKNVSLFSLTLKSGSYFLEYDYKKGEFLRYSLPIKMSEDFPQLEVYKDKVEAAGCLINESNGIFYIKNEYWNTITINSEVGGDCKRSDKYMGGKVYEIEFPINSDILTRFKIWLKKFFNMIIYNTNTQFFLMIS